jgi:outer membrane receptor protein involved in Fe transport
VIIMNNAAGISGVFLRLAPTFGLVLLTLIFIGSDAAQANAQAVNVASISGVVRDANGAVVPGADVSIWNRSTGAKRETQTSGEGRYSFASLPLTGEYVIKVVKAGFNVQEIYPVELKAGETATIDVALGVAGTTAEVNILGTTEGVQADSAQLGVRLDAQKIDETTVLGRKMTNLVTLNSATRSARGTGDLFLNNYLFVANGSGRRQTTVTLDGGSGDDDWGRQTVFTNIPISSLQEFSILTNAASAQYGRTAGSVVNIVTKAGTNDYHFDLINMFRPGGIEANPPATPAGFPLLEDKLFQLSGTVSGPIVKDKTQFMIGGEYNRQRRDSVVTSLLAPGVFQGLYNQGLLIARIDHKLNDNNTLTGRFNFDVFSDTNPQDAVGNFALPSTARTFRRKTYIGQVSETAIISPRLINEAHFQVQFGSPITHFDPAAPSPQFVRTLASGASLSTEGESRVADLFNHQFQFADTMTFISGRHDLHFGGDAVHSSSGGLGQEFGSGFVLGQFTFLPGAGCVGSVCQPTSSLTIANVQRYTQSFGNATYNVKEWNWSLFAQDDFKIRRDLTLNLGIRYDRQTFTDDTNNFAPRVGFAYNFRGDGKTVIRGSYGIYYSQLRANLGAQFALSGTQGVFTYTANAGQPGFPTSLTPFTSFPLNAIPARNIVIRPGRASYYSQFFDVSKLRGYPDKLLNPYTQQAVFGFERELPGKWIISADWVYAHTIEIDRLLDMNAPSFFNRTAAGQTRTAAAADATRPIVPVNNGFRRIQVVSNEGTSIYHGLQTKLTKRFSDNFSILASYTWSHTINTVEPDAGGGDPNEFSRLDQFEKADSQLDQRHKAVISGWWSLPYKFTLGGVTTLASGRPYNIITGTDNNGDGANVDRPVINGVLLSRNAGHTSAIYDTSLFLEREFALTEKLRLGVRAEGFNLFNHANTVGRNSTYGNAANSLPAATLGQVLSGVANVEPGRQFQFQVRLRY